MPKVLSLFLLVFISLIINICGNKKDVGVNFSVPIPVIRLSHCPFSRISNASQPTPSDIILYQIHLRHKHSHSCGWDIIHPRGRSVALPLYVDSKLRSLITQIVTSENVLSLRLVLTNGFLLPPDSLDVLTRHPSWTGLVICKINNNCQNDKKNGNKKE